MFIIIQIPFVDLRVIQKADARQCFFPHKFMNRTGKKVYFRHFGSKHFRQHADGLPQSECCYFDARRMIKLNNIDLSSRLVFARLFAEDFFLHFDIGIRISNHIDQKDLMDIIKKIVTDNIFIIPNLNKKESGKEKTICSLNSIQKYIESLYMYATSYISNNINDYRMLKKDAINLSFGNPSIFCQYKCSDGIMQDFSNKIINLDNCLDVYKTTMNNYLYLVHVWIAGKKKDTGETKDVLRRLRICLLKLHNYREGLMCLFQFLDNRNPREDDKYSDILCIKFKYLLQLLKRTTHYGMQGKHIMDLALQTEKDIYYENWEDHIERLEYYYNYFDEIEKRREKIMNVNFNGEVSFNNSTFNNIDGGGNTLNQSNVMVSSDINELLIEFDKEFDRLLIELTLSNPDVDKLKDYKREFKEEVTSSKRDRIKLSDIMRNIKNAFTGFITNADKLSLLFDLGNKIIEKLK